MDHKQALLFNEGWKIEKVLGVEVTFLIGERFLEWFALRLYICGIFSNEKFWSDE